MVSSPAVAGSASATDGAEHRQLDQHGEPVMAHGVVDDGHHPVLVPLLRCRRAERAGALIRLALDFWTWRRLSREGLDDEDAADLMAAAIATHAQ